MKKKLPNSLTVLIATLITILFWIGFEVYRTFTKPADINVPESVLKPLTPNLDIDSLSEIEGSIELSQEELESLRQTNPLNATPSATIVPEETQEENPTETPEESPTESPNISPTPTESGGGI